MQKRTLKEKRGFDGFYSNSYRTIWFARSGPSRIEHLYKADSELSPLGEEYAERLCKFLRQRRRVVKREGEQENRLTVWTSSRRRCIQTSAPMAKAGYKVLVRSQMNEVKLPRLSDICHLRSQLTTALSILTTDKSRSN